MIRALDTHAEYMCQVILVQPVTLASPEFHTRLEIQETQDFYSLPDVLFCLVFCLWRENVESGYVYVACKLTK